MHMSDTHTNTHMHMHTHTHTHTYLRPLVSPPPQLASEPLRVRVEHLKDESYANDDVVKVRGCLWPHGACCAGRFSGCAAGCRVMRGQEAMRSPR